MSSKSSLSILNLRWDILDLEGERAAFKTLRLASGMSGDGDLAPVPTNCADGADTPGAVRGTSGDNDLISKRAGDLVLVPTSGAGGAIALGSARGTSGDNDLVPEGAGVGGKSKARDRALLLLSSRSPASRTTYGSRGTTRPDLIQLLIHALLSTARVGSPRTEWRAARCSGSVARWPGSRLRMM
jgi:hypothetical protein